MLVEAKVESGPSDKDESAVSCEEDHSRQLVAYWKQLHTVYADVPEDRRFMVYVVKHPPDREEIDLAANALGELLPAKPRTHAGWLLWSELEALLDEMRQARSVLYDPGREAMIQDMVTILHRIRVAPFLGFAPLVPQLGEAAGAARLPESGLLAITPADPDDASSAAAIQMSSPDVAEDSAPTLFGDLLPEIEAAARVIVREPRGCRFYDDSRRG